MRPVKACLQCRTGKRRCDGARGETCSQCVQRNLACSAAADAQPESQAPVALQPLPTVVQTRAEEEMMYLVDLYFRFINDQPHSLFHEHTFKASVAAGTASRTVTLGMMGLSARFATHTDVRTRGQLYASQAKAALKDDLEHICIDNLQSSILVGNICFGDGGADAESLYFGTPFLEPLVTSLSRVLTERTMAAYANRMAQILNLGVSNPEEDGVTRETKRRIFWTCFITDTWASGGSDLSRQFRSQPKRPRVPMDEKCFYEMRTGDPDIPDEEWKPGLWGHMVRLVEIYSQIQDLHKHLAETIEWDEDLIDEAVRGLDAQLFAFEQNLEPQMHFSLENLAIYVDQGLGSVFIAFHLGYHHYYTLLFYLYLDQRRPSTRNGKIYAARCKAHATIICDVLKASRGQPGAEALYNIVGHVTIVSSSVLLHTYLFGEAHELPDSKHRLESNLESLVQLRGYWSSVELMINRLVVFQNNCMRSLSRNTHRFDKWMVKFLIAHALAVENKVDDMLDREPEFGLDQTTGNERLERSRITRTMVMDIQNTDAGYG